ncbi:MAG: polysaccharide biosynthesis/export family protein [Cyanobacteria bacterium J06649_4]
MQSVPSAIKKISETVRFGKTAIRILRLSAGASLGVLSAFNGALPAALAQQQNLPSLTPSENSSSVEQNTPMAAPPAPTTSATPATSTDTAEPASFRAPVRPTQTQPSISQPLPQPLSPALPFNTNNPLKPGDVVSITVLGFEELSGQQQVSSTGTVQLPLGGPVFIGGFTPIEARSTLMQALLPYVRRPEVSVDLVSASPLRVSVSGEVLRPGPRLLEPVNSANREQSRRRPPTLSTALLESGGITPSADLRNIVIRRAVPTRQAGTAAPYGEFRVNLWDAVSNGDLSADPQIFDGDEIIVPTADVANIDQRTLLSSTVAPSEITVQVAGEVTNPGQIRVAPTVGVSGAVAAAGGPTPDADTGEVTLLRQMPDGSVDQILYAFGEASEPLIDGDVVFVEPSAQGNVGDVFDFVGRILNPFGLLFNIFD